MKSRIFAMMMLAVGLTACSLDNEENDEFKPKTETWTVTIEPEYTVGYSYWGAYTGMAFQMEATDGKGKQMGKFFLNEIQGFSFEEGYRYRLEIEASTTDPRVMDAGAYTFKLKKVLSKEYVGVRTDGRREVTMDVRTVLMLTPDPASSRGFYFLCGRSTDGTEKIDMGIHEIFGLDSNLFFTSYINDDIEPSKRYACKMRLSLTPSTEPVYGTHDYRIRMEKLLGQQEFEGDSIVVAATMEEYESKEKEMWF